MSAGVPDPFLQQVGANILAARKARDMTQAQLAHRARINRVRLSRIENGAQNFNMDTVRRLALALDVPPAQLFAGIELNLLAPPPSC